LRKTLYKNIETDQKQRFNFDSDDTLNSRTYNELDIKDIYFIEIDYHETFTNNIQLFNYKLKGGS
jgi:hypothetical protein